MSLVCEQLPRLLADEEQDMHYNPDGICYTATFNADARTSTSLCCDTHLLRFSLSLIDISVAISDDTRSAHHTLKTMDDGRLLLTDGWVDAPGRRKLYSHLVVIIIRLKLK